VTRRIERRDLRRMRARNLSNRRRQLKRAERQNFRRMARSYERIWE
jgi:hypothetical protein